MESKKSPLDYSPEKEWLLLITLAAVQFTNILDFMVMMPLGPQLMRVFSISPQEFGFAVSAYTLSAGITGFIAAFFIDRFDRKKALLALYGGFTVGTFLCAVAPTYGFLVVARLIAGAFGGILGATVFAAVGDAIPEVRRGAATGTVMTSFSIASIAGVPLGLYLANNFGWHMTFFLLAAMSVLILGGAARFLPSMTSHLATRTNDRPLAAMKILLTRPVHLRAFAFMSAMIFAGFTVIPYIAPYLVSNAGLLETELPYGYFFGGACTIFSARYIGRLADRHGKAKVFTWIALLSILPVIAITNLPPLSLPVIIVVLTMFTVLVSGRMTPAMALIIASVDPKRRGSFMSINSSVQQLAAGIASLAAGAIIGRAPDGSLTHYGIVGGIASVTTVICVGLARRLHSFHVAQAKVTEHPVAVESI